MRAILHFYVSLSEWLLFLLYHGGDLNSLLVDGAASALPADSPVGAARLPSNVPPAFGTLPEFLLEDVADFLHLVIQ